MTEMRKLIRVNGEETDFDAALSLDKIRELIGCDCIDTVMLADDVHVMIVDDTGLIDGKPLNEKATQLYWEKCGGPVDAYIAGDVVIVPDADFAESEVDA